MRKNQQTATNYPEKEIVSPGTTENAAAGTELAAKATAVSAARLASVETSIGTPIDAATEAEYKRLMALFDGADEKRMGLLDGMIRESAKCRAELEFYQKRRDTAIAAHGSRDTVIAIQRQIIQCRAAYRAINANLMKWLCDEKNPQLDEGLEEYL